MATRKVLKGGRSRSTQDDIENPGEPKQKGLSITIPLRSFVSPELVGADKLSKVRSDSSEETTGCVRLAMLACRCRISGRRRQKQGGAKHDDTTITISNCGPGMRIACFAIQHTLVKDNTVKP